MTIDKDIPRFLGFAYLIQFIFSFVNELFFSAATGTGDTAAMLQNIANNVVFVHLSIISNLITCMGIVAMALFLYMVLKGEQRFFAIIALAFWLIEASMLILVGIGSYALIPLSFDFVQAGSPSPSYFITLSDLALALKEFSFLVHMLFFASGGLMWYYLFLRSEYIPRAFALFPLIIFPFMLVDITLGLLGFTQDSIYRMTLFLAYIPYIPYEPVLGLWFLKKGLREKQTD